MTETERGGGRESVRDCVDARVGAPTSWMCSSLCVCVWRGGACVNENVHACVWVGVQSHMHVCDQSRALACACLFM